MKTIRLTPASDLACELPQHTNTRVELADGLYFLSQPLRLPSGLTLCAAPGAQPVISGGQRITGWRQEAGRWVAEVDFAFTQLFVNGQRRPRARLPKTGFYEFESLPDGRTTEWYKGATCAVYAPGDCARWQNLADVRLIALQAWFEIHLRLADVDEKTRMLTFVTRAFNNLHDETGKNARYYVENAIEALTEPGEWCLTGGKLYYLPRPGETPENAEVIAPRLATLVRLEDCRDVRLENLHFRHADWELPAENTGAVQAAFNVPGAIQFRRATDCVMQNCTVSQVAGYAIEVQLGSTGNRILDCEMHDLGAGGVKINHDRPVATRATEDEAFAGMDLAVYGWAEAPHPDPLPASGARESTPGLLSPAAGERIKVRGHSVPSQTEVAHCRIHDGGKIFHSAVGVWIGDSGFNHVHHNEIFDLYYTGISCGWSWNYAPTRCIGNVIEHNHVYNIGRKLLSDMGAIYLLGLQPGGVVRGNHVHHVSCYGYGGSGIYPDQGSSFLTIEDNVVHHTQTDALSIHYAQGLTVRNNVFALTGSGLIARGREESVLAGLFERNLLYGTTPKMLGYSWNNFQTVILRENRFWVAGGAPPDFAGLNFEEWTRFNGDTGSAVDNSVAAVYDRRLAEIGNSAVADRRYSSDRVILEPRLELGEPTFPTAADGERLSVMPVTVYANANEPQQLSLTLTNRGLVTARGTGEFFVLRDGVATLTGRTQFSYELPPGAHSVHSIAVTLAPDSEPVMVAVRDTADQFPIIGQCLTRRQDLRIARIGAVRDVTAVSAALAGQPPRVLRARGRELAELRLAVADDWLAILARVRDAVRQPNPAMPWQGSSLELFCQSTTSHLKVQQYFAFPGGAARTDHKNAAVCPEPGIAVACENTADGYELAVLAPLALFELPVDVTEFPFEIVVNTTPQAGGGALQGKLFGATFSWMGMDGWGMVRVK